MTVEAAACPHAPVKKKYLPNKILRAIDSAAELDKLKSGVRITLQTICRYVQQHDPLGPVWTRREKIAARAKVSVRTVDRHIAKLEQLGLVKVEEQRHAQRNGKFLVTHLFLTEKLAQLVGLVETVVEGAVKDSPSDKMADGYIKVLTVPSSSSKKQGRPAAPVGGVPADLAPLLDLGMMAPTIFKLMSMAKARGKLLSDVFAVVKDRLQALQLAGGQIRNYLAKAIAGNTDFAAQRAKAEEQARVEAKLDADRAYIAAFQVGNKGRVLRSVDGSETVAISADGSYAQITGHRRCSTMPLHNRTDVAWLAERIADGRLVEGRAVAPVAERPIVVTAGVARTHLAGALAMLRSQVVA